MGAIHDETAEGREPCLRYVSNPLRIRASDKENPKCLLLSWGQLLLAQSHRLHEALSWRDREAWADWKDIRVALAALEGSGYFKLESEDGEAKTKKLVWSVCVDPEGITALDGLSARKMSATTWVSIPKKADKAPVTAGETTGTTSIKDFNTEVVT